LRIGAPGNVATVAVLAALLGVVDPALKSLLSLQKPPALQGRAAEDLPNHLQKRMEGWSRPE
jgi:hypothetical protein